MPHTSTKGLSSAVEEIQAASRAMIKGIANLSGALNEWKSNEATNNPFIEQAVSNEDHSMGHCLNQLMASHADLIGDLGCLLHYELNAIGQYGETYEQAWKRSQLTTDKLDKEKTTAEQAKAKGNHSKAAKGIILIQAAQKEDEEARSIAAAWYSEYERVKHDAFGCGVRSLAKTFQRFASNTAVQFDGLSAIAAAIPDVNPSEDVEEAIESFRAVCTAQKEAVGANPAVPMTRRPGGFLSKKPEKSGIGQKAQKRFFQLENTSSNTTVFAYYEKPPAALDSREVKGMIPITADSVIQMVDPYSKEIEIVNPERTWGLATQTSAEAKWWTNVLIAAQMEGGVPALARNSYDSTVDGGQEGGGGAKKK